MFSLNAAAAGFRMVEKVCLKSQKFQEDLALSLQRLRADGDFSDVTLVCEDGEQFGAHRVILASLSPVFESIFKRNCHHPQPLIYMRGVSSSPLGQVLMFLYQGEVEVPEDGLHDFLAFAKEFKVKGLVEKPDTTAVFIPEKSDHQNDLKVEHHSDVDDKLRRIFKSEEAHLNDEIESDANAQKRERIDQNKKTSQFICQYCDFTATDKWHMNRHTMAKHTQQPNMVCLVTSCNKSFETLAELKVHKEACYMQCQLPGCGIRFILMINCVE